MVDAYEVGSVLNHNSHIFHGEGGSALCLSNLIPLRRHLDLNTNEYSGETDWCLRLPLSHSHCTLLSSASLHPDSLSA